MDSPGEKKRRDKEEIALRGEKPGRGLLLNGVKLQVSSQDAGPLVGPLSAHKSLVFIM